MNKNNDMTNTRKLDGPILYNKSVPSICSRCGAIYKITQWVVEDGRRTGATHGLCRKCFEELQKHLEERIKEQNGNPLDHQNSD